MNRLSRLQAEQFATHPYPEHILIVTDAWQPQMNGVVRTLEMTCTQLRLRGHRVTLISPDQFHSVACPTYPEIRLALNPPRAVGKLITSANADAIHIATEGPLGFAARRFCVRHGIPFTTAFHTRFPDYCAARTGLSPRHFWRYIRWFHAPARQVMTATESLREELRGQGLTRLHHWGRGVDLACFAPDAPKPLEYERLAHPIQLYVGRVAIEKNIEAFLSGNYPGSKVVVGDGPALAELKQRFPHTLFAGRQTGRELAGYYAGTHVFVFPSRTDTFGLVMIEALACGTPVAAFPVTGPVDIVTDEVGALSENLDRAIAAAVFSDRKKCSEYGASFGWNRSTDQFVSGLVPNALEIADAA